MGYEDSHYLLPEGQEVKRENRFAEQRVALALRQASSGTPVAEIIRRTGVSEPTFYRWTKQ